MKRLLATLGAAAGLLVWALPAPVEAARSTAFNASARLCITTPPTLVRAQVHPPIARIVFTGEELQGLVTSSPQWPALQGAAVTFRITRETDVFNLVTQTFQGQLEGRLRIAMAGGNLRGGMEGHIRGAFADPNNIVETIYTTETRARWSVEGEDVEARGTATATFGPDPNGFCGDVALNGTFRADDDGHGNRPDNDDEAKQNKAKDRKPGDWRPGFRPAHRD